MESTLVIKVKYGDTLRRFSARVDESNQLDLDMDGLKAKILSLFNITADANLMLRYVDEDGDLVNLVDDDDLQDVLRQRLKFLRIDVHISNGSGGKSNARSSGSATPLRSPSVPNPFPSGNVVIAPDALKSVPEPLLEAISKLSLDLVSKATSSGPVLTNLADSVSKMGQSILTSHFQPHVAAGSSTNSGVPEEPITPEARGAQSTLVDSNANASQQAEAGNVTRGSVPVVSVAIAPDALKSVPEPLREAVSEISRYYVSKVASSSPVLTNLVDSISKMGQSIPTSHRQPHVAAGSSSNNGVPEEPLTPEARGPQSTHVDSTSNASQQVEAGNVTRGVVPVVSVDLNVLPSDPYSSQSTNVNAAPLSSAVPGGDCKKGKTSTDDSGAGKGDNSRTSASSAAPNNSSIKTPAMSSAPFNECPFSGAYSIDLMAPSLGNHRISLGNYGIHPFKRSYSHSEATSGMFHKGVRCYGCGVYPITGPRFKSKVKVNYDLCSICFNEMGNETDYIRMDRPSSSRPMPPFFKGVYEHAPRMSSPTSPQICKIGSILKQAKPKLDSRFILDVNVIDGTMMAPSTAFTKIWRMRNNGTVVWPKGTQLVWTGGDKFSDSHSVDLEVPDGGIPVDKELDIAVDFRAPQLPGRYISYWRMASPSGHKFGQRVWVLIQVDASLKDSFYDSSQGLNLNIPLDFNGSKGPQIIDINVQPTEDDAFFQPHNASASTEPVNQMVDKHLRPELENEFPINEATFVGHAASPPVSSAAPSSVSYPIVDFSETAPAVPSNQQSSAEDAPSSSLGIDVNNSVEETLLKELEEMGFKQVDLNKEILRMNEYNLEQSVDDLCGVFEWDPILEELQEMGFRDNEMNKKLLMKNNGSIKRVVMDLINGEKA